MTFLGERGCAFGLDSQRPRLPHGCGGHVAAIAQTDRRRNVDRGGVGIGCRALKLADPGHQLCDLSLSSQRPRCFAVKRSLE